MEHSGLLEHQEEAFKLLYQQLNEMHGYDEQFEDGNHVHTVGTKALFILYSTIRAYQLLHCGTCMLSFEL